MYARGGVLAAGIGTAYSPYSNSYSRCGNITITSGITALKAYTTRDSNGDWSGIIGLGSVSSEAKRDINTCGEVSLSFKRKNVGDKEGFATLVSTDSERAFALRNELTGNGLDLTLDKADLEEDVTSYFLLSMLKIKLCHDFTISNNKMILDIHESEEREEVTSGTTLFLLLNTVAYITLAKEYGFITDQLDINRHVEQTKRMLSNFPHSIGYESAMGELDHLIDNADNLADSYLMSNQYKL